jgi:prepilin-type processing-associated H-X9-DG protein
LPGVKGIFVCPSLKPGSQGTYGTGVDNPWFAYSMNRVLQGVLPSPPGQGLYKRSVADKASETVFLAEGGNDKYPFTDGYFIGPNYTPYAAPRHSGGMNFVFVDGHAQWYSQAEYGRAQPMFGNPNAAQSEWSVQHSMYWFPCRTCNKS